jgi:hypothetical protein
MTRSDGVSQAHELTLDIEGARIFPAGPTVGFTGLIFNSAPFNAQPGANSINIPIEDLGTPWIATASVTELGADGTAQAGQTVIFTTSVQLDQDGHFVRVYFVVESESPLPVSIQLIIGHIP